MLEKVDLLVKDFMLKDTVTHEFLRKEKFNWTNPEDDFNFSLKLKKLNKLKLR